MGMFWNKRSKPKAPAQKKAPEKNDPAEERKKEIKDLQTCRFNE